MILYSFNWTGTVVWVLSISLAVLIVLILYKKLLAYFGRNTPDQKDYCVLYSLEKDQQTGEIEIYFTTEKPRHVEILILDSDLKPVATAAKGEFTAGGNIVRFNTDDLENGNYYYCLKTENQKTMKKMVVHHLHSDKVS